MMSAAPSAASLASSVDSAPGNKAYSPMSTLEKQYNTNRVFLFVRTNNNCWLPGGVEYILSQTSKFSESSTTVAPPPAPSPGSADGSENPFEFLSQESAPQIDTPTTSDSRKGFKGFLKKVAKSTTEKLERGMTNLAIRADKGRNPDMVTAGLYDANDQVISMTESIPYPVTGTAEGMRFVIPLVVPAGLTQAVIKLWIRSGASWLEKTKAAKNYLLGSCPVAIKPSTYIAGAPLHSSWVVDGQVSVLMLPDLKFPHLCGNGWSLVDPLPSSHRFNLTLDQSYAFGVPSQPASSFLVGTERATESTVVLPVACAVAQLCHKACQVSWHHGQSVTTYIAQSRHDVLPPNAPYGRCDIRIGDYRCNPLSMTNPPVLTVSWQRPDSIFEVELGNPMYMPATGNEPSITFYPKPCKEGVLPGFLQAHGGTFPANGFFLGNLHFQLVWTIHPHQPRIIWDATVSLDTLLADSNVGTGVLKECTLFDAVGQPMGTFQATITLQMQGMDKTPFPVTPATGGLVALMGLPRLLEFTIPSLDYNDEVLEASMPFNPDRERRKQQIATMGTFVTKAYMESHMENARAPDVNMWAERAQKYKEALTRQQEPERLPPHEDKSPRPFRPSSSRSEVSLAGIPFNVHTSSMSLSVFEADKIVSQSPGTDPSVSGAFFNTSCGAPSDHARGFGNIFPNVKENSKEAAAARAAGVLGPSPVGPVSGGLRRLETKRQEIAILVTNLQTALTMGIANYFVERRQVATTTPVTHVPARHPELAEMRSRLCEAVQSFHHITWTCASRRAACFSQALGTALSCYLSNVSDPAKMQSAWPDLWAKHGFLVSFEGLLSAAGKELGMIEDASVGIAMLGMVKVMLVSDDGSAPPIADSVSVVDSPYLKWLAILPSGTHPETEFTVQIGIVQSYFEQRIPAELKGGTAVRFFPLLFEVGVDIRQWGAHAGSNMKSSLEEKWKNRNISVNSETGDVSLQPPPEQPKGGLIEDEDDDEGVTDDDVLVQLNSEAFQKLNAYAYLISPAINPIPPATQQVHPMLETLYQHIMSSAGRINHDIVDEAATLAQQLGGGGIVFCKSGKDRTAMHMTYKQAQFGTRFRQLSKVNGNGGSLVDTTLDDARMMRIHGTRLPICEKNVGQAKYAFNSLQVQFMPDRLKPPMSTLAGFLKGGKVFSGGGIES
ncbi:inositol polyphosphate-4-phosphatase [Fistulifera solaris]|uniref:Inositol polyphosphate-4-phosphatase n=1 Tax=Fistulifera solaris TaxID=1519565 RepID=A0A1Z5K3P4_FISSO|nr:inositol polyphosphate-4-phosphatase [Fistulifera solaris]|eukprot:GAX20873.1 inositol polyphosphate-4-phosphatase [Fistulifera solaris]